MAERCETPDYDDEFDDEQDDEWLAFSEEDCGRWDNGRLTHSCLLAGTEECDWECPLRASLYQTTGEYEKGETDGR